MNALALLCKLSEKPPTQGQDLPSGPEACAREWGQMVKRHPALPLFPCIERTRKVLKTLWNACDGRSWCLDSDRRSHNAADASNADIQDISMN